MLIRPATVADVPALRALDQASPFGARWTDSHYQRFFAAADSQKHLLLVSEVRSEVQSDPIAYLAASGVGEEWELENVVVAESNQRRGVACALLQELFEKLRSENVKSVHLEVRESNTHARALYAHLGFTETGRRTHYYAGPTEDALLFVREL